MMTNYFNIVFFGILGISARFFIDKLLPSPSMISFPLSTFLINITGSFLIGATYVLGFEKAQFSIEIRTALISGFLGGFTTFSTYSLQSLLLFMNEKIMLSLVYSILSPLLGIISALFGIIIFRKFF